MDTGYAGVIVDLSGCFLLSFSAHPAPLNLLTLIEGEGYVEGRAKQTWGGEGKKPIKLAEVLKKAAGRRQAWDSDRLKRVGKKETSLDRLRRLVL